MYIQQRNIATCVIFTILTCGLYGLYWLACLANDANRVSGRQCDTSGGLVVLFTLLTCDIYHIYWSYKVGEKMDEARANRGLNPKNSGLIYLLLSLFGLSIITWALVQSELNELAEGRA